MSELALRDASTMAARCIRLSRRNIDALMMSLTLPVMLMLMFVYLFGGAIETGSSYVTYVVPGVLLLCAGFGASMTAVSVSHDMSTGIVDRFRSMDIGGVSILSGHVVASITRNLVSTVLVFGLAFAIGFRPQAGPLAWLAAIAVLVAFLRGHLVAVGGGRPAGPFTRGGRRLHLLRDVPALSEQRLRADRDDAVVDPGLRPSPTRHTRHRDPARPAPRPSTRDERGHGPRLVRRHPRGRDRRHDRTVPPPHRLTGCPLPPARIL